MGFFANLFGKKTEEAVPRDYSNRATPDPHRPEGQAPYVRAWDGYASSRSGDPLRTIGREPRQVAGDYPSGENQFDSEVPLWTVAPGAVMGERPRSPDPRWVATTPIRPQRTPSTYRTVNPFDWQYARQLNGLHFSMASNLRTYAIGGMQPVIARRNTWRMLPPPHDINQTDLPRSGTSFDVSEMDIRGVVSGGRSPTARLR